MNSKGKRGFAVIVTLLLLSLVTMWIMVLATVERLEERIGDRAGAAEAARQHALMALRVALGRLQILAGPDQRCTATAGAFDPVPGAEAFTGVWSTSESATPPLAWLVSGKVETPSAYGAEVGSALVELVGLGTADRPDAVTVALEPIVVGTQTTGHFAWWVGDEGVKASVAIADRTDLVTYAPYDSAESRSRLRQLRALDPGPADATGAAVVEPRDQANQRATATMLDDCELAFLAKTDGTGQLGAAARSYFPAWTANHRAVLADSRRGGLRQDLSINPGLLGAAFAAWSDPAGSMEDPRLPLSPFIAPGYPSVAPMDALRRRYRLTPPLSAAGIDFSIAPTLSYFLLTFNVRTDPSASGSDRPLQVRARWLLSFWNPYTSGLVPVNLAVEVSGLPTLSVVNDSTGGSVGPLSLDSLYGSPFRIALPWVPGGRNDQQSWLPGRVYTWSALENLDQAGAPPPSGFDSVFYSRSVSTTAGQGVQRSVGSLVMPNSASAHLTGGAVDLTVKLFRVNASGGRDWLRTFTSPHFSAFATTPAPINAATYSISYVFRLAESIDTPLNPSAWLELPGGDPRAPAILPDAYLPPANGPRPELYPNYTTVSFPDRLLDRALPASAGSTTGQSYNEDAPLFDLPRFPLLSMGALQHLALAGARPFSLGNSWGAAGGWNAWFDRYFFSGLATSIDAPGDPDSPLPNTTLHPAGRRADGTRWSPADLHAAFSSGDTASVLLQDGAFNVNSTEPLAWLAVLRAGRGGEGETFRFLDASVNSGTAGDVGATTSATSAATFWRFPFSAQETYKADAGYAASTSQPPVSPTTPSLAGTHLIRRGRRILSEDQVAALASQIAQRAAARLRAFGPFRSIEEFLAPSPLFNSANLLEDAIAHTFGADGRALNDPATVTEFSSQTLTSADVMSALAPILTARSDTFVIRAYGDASQPGTGDRVARAWLEARVQRVPDYVDPSDPPATAPAALNPVNARCGRRFRLVSLRWLAPADL